MSVTERHIALASQFHMVIHQRQKQGQNGHVLGRGAGSSTDYLDHRRYVLGDDIRRLDWNAYARTDQLLVKRYQEEIRPVIEIWYDDSSSMALRPEKGQLTIDLVAFLAQVCRNDGVEVRIFRLSQGVIPLEEVLLATESFASTISLEEMVFNTAPRSRKDAHIFLISDFLSPHDPQKIISTMARKAATVTAIQVLAKEDYIIDEEQAVLLEDSETGELIEIDLDPLTIEAYLNSLQTLQDDWERQLMGWGGVFRVLSSSQSFLDGCKTLVEARVLGF